jgi:diguanylate cyclase (GGDEF)-like protein
MVQLVVGATPNTWAVAMASVTLFALVVIRMHAAIQQVTASRAQRDRLQDALEHQAGHDSLTTLANRARVLELIEAGLHRGQRSGALVGLLFVDLDHFKAVNDTHGHRAGDDVLRETAARMRSLVRTGDTVGRLGGDEFVVLVESLTSDERGPVELAERLIAAISMPVRTGGHDVMIGASIGVAINRDGGTDAAALLHEADAAAYRAKAAGRGRVEVFDDALRRQLHDRAELEEAIRTGLDDREFALHYQPVVDLAGGTVLGYEALIRWHRPGHGLVAPDAFIPTAEKSTLICHLGRWVLGEATRQLAQWLAERPDGDQGTTVAVNVSGRHLASASIVSDVTGALHASGLPAGNLVLEITETVLLDEPAATPHLRALRALGVRISIDDFGTGYTSIGQLQHLHADTLKIDKSLVGSTSPGAAELVELVVRAAHAFGLNVVAEGVEREDQLSALHHARCDSAQGYLFARPQPAMGGIDVPGRPVVAQLG